MMQRAMLSGALLLAVAGAGLAQEAVLERDLERLATMLAGVYDNQEQVYFEPELGVPESERHARRRLHLARVESEATDDERFEWRRYDDGAMAPAARGLVALTVDAASNAIRMRRYTLPIQADIERAAVAPGDVGTRECDVLWRRRAGQFEGHHDPAQCDASEAGGRWLLADTELQVGGAVAGATAANPFVLRRARAFSCWVAVPLRDSDRWHFDNDLRVYDQGGSAEVITDEPEPQRVRIKMRNVVWPTGTNRDSLVLYVYRGGETAAASYAWGEPTATRLAINLRWMQASCTLAD